MLLLKLLVLMFKFGNRNYSQFAIDEFIMLAISSQVYAINSNDISLCIGMPLKPEMLAAVSSSSSSSSGSSPNRNSPEVGWPQNV